MRSLPSGRRDCFAADLTEEGSLPPAAVSSSTFVRLDVTSEQEVRAAIDLVARQAGKLDILVNAAGIERAGHAACVAAMKSGRCEHR